MSANPSKVPVQSSNEPRPLPSAERRPFGSLRREMDRLFDDFDRGFLGFPFRRAVKRVGAALAERYEPCGRYRGKRPGLRNHRRAARTG